MSEASKPGNAAGRSYRQCSQPTAAADSRLYYNHLAAAEMGEEENYNQIDGIINNTKKPSILEHLSRFKPLPTGDTDMQEQSAEIEL